MRYSRILMVVAFVTLSASIAFAENTYIGFQAGPVFRTDSDMTQEPITFETSYKTGYLLGITAGTSFQDFRLEGELSYRSNEIDEGKAFGTSIPMGGDVTSTALMVNGYYDIRTSSVVRPYIGIGVGFAQVSIKDFEIGGIIVADDDDIVFAYQAAAGVNFDITPRFALDLGYRYFATTDPSFEDVGGFPFDVEYDSHNVVVGAKFKF